MNKLVNAIKKPYRFVRRRLMPERPMPPTCSNVEYNREYWNRYAKAWDKTRNPIENPHVTENQQATYIKYLGDEWGRASDVEEIVAEYIYPFITQESVVAEIGVGGARVASNIDANNFYLKRDYLVILDK